MSGGVGWGGHALVEEEGGERIEKEVGEPGGGRLS